MRALSRASILAALCAISAVVHAADAKEFNLKVVDELGQPVQQFKARVHSPGGGGLDWMNGSNGNVQFPSAPQSPVLDVIVRADGYASVINRFAGEDREKLLRGEVSLTIPRGEKVKFRFHVPDGLSWPKDAVPDVYFASCADEVHAMRSPSNRKVYETHRVRAALDSNTLNVHLEESGNFSLQLAPDTAPFFVGIHIPGFFGYFDAGPFTAADVNGGVLEVQIPKPANLEITFDPGSTPANERPFKSTSIQVMMQSPGKGSSYATLTDRTDTLDSKPLNFADLPPANYWVTFRTVPDGDPNKPYTGKAEPGRFFDSKKIALQAGQTEKIDFHYVPFDPNAFHGNRTAEVRIETADGKPPVGRDVAINYYVEHYGLLPVFSGSVPDTGEITLNEITDVRPASIGSHNPYSVSIDKQPVGGFGFKTSEPTEHFTFRCPPQAGDMAPDVELLNVADGKTIKLSDLRGKLVLLDFWATWCGPCQPALEKLDTVAAEKADAWKDRVVILPVSIDDESEKAKTHLLGRGWTHLTPYWTGAEGKTSFEAPAMQAFVVNGVPTSFLIAPDGKILWRGHPLSTEGGKTLEDRIDAALNGSPAAEKPAAQSNKAAGAPMGRLVDIQGQPIAGAQIKALARGSQACLIIDGVTQHDQNETSKENGLFSIPSSPDAGGKSVSLAIVSKNGHYYEANVVPVPGQTIDVHVPTHLHPHAAGPQNVGAEEFAGVVVDESGQPLEGVEVDAWDWYKRAGNEMTTGGDGVFRLTNLDHEPDEGIEVRFRKPGYSPETLLHQPLGVKGWVLALADKTSFEGTVRGPDGKPAPATSIKANQGPRYSEGVMLSDILTETKSDPAGRYRLYVQPDEYVFFVKCPGVGSARLPKSAIEFGQTNHLDIQLQPSAVFQARIVDAETNKPVPNIRLFKWQNNDIDGRSNQEGLVALRDMIPGMMQFDVQSDGYTRWWSDQCKSPGCKKSIDKPELKWQRNFDFLDFDVEPNMPPVTIMVEKGARIRGRVIDPDGQPVAGATVAPALTGTGNSLTGDTRFSVETKADGNFEMLLPASHDAKYNLIAHDGKYGLWRKWANAVLPPISTTPGQEIDGVELQLTRPAVVRGKVIDAQGKPVAGREVRTSAVDKLENRYYDPTTKTKPDGTFELAFVRPGEQYVQSAPFWLTAEQAPPASTKRVTLKAGQELNDIELTAAAK